MRRPLSEGKPCMAVADGRLLPRLFSDRYSSAS